LASIVIKNWDNKNWLSSRQYINFFNNFILSNYRLNNFSDILDIGCGRGKIIGDLKTKLNLKKKPIGIDLVNHRDKDKRMKFKKIDALSFFLNNEKKFDLILIKQTLHLLDFKKIKKLLSCCKKNLNPRGVILVFTLDPQKNQIPKFQLMKEKLNKSLLRDQKISKILFKAGFNKRVKKLAFKVMITKKDYLKMIQKKFISTLLYMKKKEILDGINEIDAKYKKMLRFNDNLICIIFKK
tara:strand:- start:2024 stop:2740 length:717 start_codon:yes stop_codon:yes gene_type:complete